MTSHLYTLLFEFKILFFKYLTEKSLLSEYDCPYE